MQPKNLWFTATAVATLALDQATKIWVVATIAPGSRGLEVIPGLFSVVHAQNPGAAGGLLGDFSYRIWLFLGFLAVASVMLVNLQRQLAPMLRFQPAILGLILGGALGNGIDRIHKQTVTDFLRFYSENPGIEAALARIGLPAEYPTFNVADIALVLGVGLFVLHYLVFDETSEARATSSPEQSPG